MDWPSVGASVIGSLGELYALLRFLPTKVAERAIGHVFDRRLEAFNYEQQKEIEGLRTKLSHISDRGLRSNEREYTSTVELWEAIVRAYLSTRECVISFSTHPDLDKMSDDRIRDFMEANSFPSKEIESVLQSDEKNVMFGRVTAVRNINACRRETRNLRLKLQNTIFIGEDLENDVAEFADLMVKAEVAATMQFEDRRSSGSTQWDLDFMKQGEPSFRGLKAKIRSRLLKYSENVSDELNNARESPPRPLRRLTCSRRRFYGLFRRRFRSRPLGRRLLRRRFARRALACRLRAAALRVDQFDRILQRDCVRCDALRQ